jgi:DNA polymerase-4
MPTIAHLDADAFYVSVELLRRPDLAGRPVVVSGSGPRAVVTTASYEARRFGVHSAIPASRARRLCPQAVFLQPDFDEYRRVSRAMWAVVRARVAAVEVMGLDEAYLDLDGIERPRAAMRALVEEIRAATGITCSVGIGPNKLVAKVASDAEKPAGFVALSREQAAARFAGERPSLVPGIGPKTAERLESMGFATIGALADAPDEILVGEFGPRLGPWLRRRARFEDHSPVVTEHIAVSESRETTFPTDVGDRGEMEDILRRLAADLCQDLARKRRQGRTIAIKVRLDDFTTITRARTIPAATNDIAEVGDMACRLLAEYDPPRPVRLLGVRVAGFAEPEPPVEEPQLALPL